MGKRWRRLLAHAGMFSPKGLLLRAAVIAAAFLVVHAAGLREYTSVLSGTPASGSLPEAFALAAGIAYATLYFGFVLLAPLLVLAAVILVLLARITRHGRRSPPGAGQS